MLKTLFLQPPSFEGFDGGAGSRFQARREVRSFWFPVWLAQPAAMVEGSKLVDAPPAGLTLQDVLPLAREHELLVMHTSTPSFASDARVAAAFKRENPALRVGMVGASVAVDPAGSLARLPALDCGPSPPPSSRAPPGTACRSGRCRSSPPAISSAPPCGRRAS
jgi:hypothetical protein